jgi:hypothetical protein
LILVFLFLISFLGLFVKVLRVFNFIHQFKFMGCYFFFLIWSSFFWFFQSFY